MGKKAEPLSWKEQGGFEKPKAGDRRADQPMTLDGDLEKILDQFGMVHEMWREKENTRFEDHRANVDATPYDEETLRTVEHAFRLVIAKIKIAQEGRATLKKAWNVARRFHWKHNLEMEAMLDQDDTVHGIVDSPLGERIYVCECSVLAGKIKKRDKRIARLGKICGYIRHALYIRNQYRSGIDIEEWTGPQIARMRLDFVAEPCKCRDCEKSEAGIKRVGPIGSAVAPGGSLKRFLRAQTENYPLSRQMKDMAAKEKGKESASKKVFVFGTGQSLDLGFMFKK